MTLTEIVRALRAAGMRNAADELEAVPSQARGVHAALLDYPSEGPCYAAVREVASALYTYILDMEGE